MSTEELCRAYVAARDGLMLRRERIQRALLSLHVATSKDPAWFARLDPSAREREIQVQMAIAMEVAGVLEGWS